jgi:CDP-2,3-bis-(O-geranylgeranyl)-sn-glycerol synthase
MGFQFLLSVFYFFLPAYFANMTPPIFMKLDKLKSLAKPVDFGKEFMGKPIFGSHKTWRGIITGIMVGTLLALLQGFLYQFSFFQSISFFDYQKINILYFGFLMALSTMIGDLTFAFIKRRLNLKPGAKFIPFDQTNYVLANAVLLTLFSGIDIDIMVWIVLFFFSFFLHVIVNRIGYHLKINRAKW